MPEFKPMLACDWHESKLKFPLILQPKIDGVRSLNRDGRLVGRSLKKHENTFTTSQFSSLFLHGIDGEMHLGDNIFDPDLCRKTSQALRTREGEPDIFWTAFDLYTETTKDMLYFERYQKLQEMIQRLPDSFKKRVKLVENIWVNSIDEILTIEDSWLEQGLEGAIIRDPYQKYKHGRCGKTHMGAWRIKRFIEEEALVIGIEEGMHNANEAKTNELGRTERSTHQENMIPNGLVGNLKCVLLKDVVDPNTGKLLFTKGTEITVSPGNMNHEMRKYYFDNPHEILQKIIKFKLFPKGIKDKPRFPTFVTIRNENDL